MSKKTQIAKLILAMTDREREAMAKDFVEMQSNAEDDGSGWDLSSKKYFANMLHDWAEGLGGME